MNEGYCHAAQETLLKAQVVVAPFHVAKHYRNCVDRPLKAEMKRLKQTLPGSEYSPLKGAMSTSRKSRKRLSEEQQIVLLSLFRQAPILKEVYVQREVLRGLFEQNLTKAQVEHALTQWLGRLAKLRLDVSHPL